MSMKTQKNADLENLPLLLTVPQVAELLQIGRNTTYDLCHISDFPTVRIGRSIRINADQLKNWLDKHEGEILL